MVDANIWFIVFWLMNEVTENNGPTIIIPKTHKHDLGDRQEEKPQVKLTGNPGDIFVMNSNLLHKASLSRDGRSRWLFIPTYNPWFIKPSVDYTKVFTKKQFEQLTEEQKQIFGFTSIVPVDERVRIYTLRPWKEQMDDIQFRSEPYPI
jgi:ectoine hydroxylase-related dioxygenase (phytanoyl-CoA dioxygenase family)